MLTSSSKPVQFIGGGPLPEFDFSQEPLPDSIRVLLWMLDGAERRHRLARKWQSHVGVLNDRGSRRGATQTGLHRACKPTWWRSHSRCATGGEY